MEAGEGKELNREEQEGRGMKERWGWGERSVQSRMKEIKWEKKGIGENRGGGRQENQGENNNKKKIN